MKKNKKSKASNSKNTWGGNRKGSGKPKGPKTKVLSIRANETVINKVKRTYTSAQIQKAGQKFIQDLADSVPKTKPTSNNQ